MLFFVVVVIHVAAFGVGFAVGGALASSIVVVAVICQASVVGAVVGGGVGVGGVVVWWQSTMAVEISKLNEIAIDQLNTWRCPLFTSF